LAKIKLGHESEGLKDIEHSMEIEPENSYGFRNLGIYHFDKGDFKTALTHFQRAFSIDKSTHAIETYIEKALLR
jgi:lipoprotein NlpI